MTRLNLFGAWEPDEPDIDISTIEVESIDVTAKRRRTLEERSLAAVTDDDVTRNEGLIWSAIERHLPGLANAIREVGYHLREDFRSIGWEAIAKAKRDYDPSKGAFSTIATTCIVNDSIKELKRMKRYGRRVIIVEIDDNRDMREMPPDVAAETWETIRRGSTVSLFEDGCHGETVCETD